MQAVGHKPVTIHEKYAELDETELLEAFQIFLQPNPGIFKSDLK